MSFKLEILSNSIRVNNLEFPNNTLSVEIEGDEIIITDGRVVISKGIFSDYLDSSNTPFSSVSALISEFRNSYTGGGSVSNPVEFTDNVFRIENFVDTTKKIAFDASGITTATTRTITVPDSDITIDSDSDSRPPDNHASNHTDGTDDIQDATAAQKGLATAAQITKLDGIEALADVTDEANVTDALDGATLTDIGTPASDDKILIQDTDDSNNLKYADFSEFSGGGGGALDYIKISDVKATGVQGGTFSSGAWRVRDLNTIDSDAGGHASVASDQITLAAGTYRFRATAPGWRVNTHALRLYNTTAAAIIAMGTNAESRNASSYASSTSHVSGRFTIGVSSVLELQHRCDITHTTSGMGNANSFGGDEVYAVIEFWKE